MAASRPGAAPQALIRTLRRALQARADPEKAGPMQAYMKSAMPYLGVPVPQMRATCRSAFDEHRLATADQWRRTIVELWRHAAHREERYAAIELAGARRYAAFQSLRMLPVYEEMIVTGAWWDYVDGIAANQLGGLLRAHPGEMKGAMRAWAACDHLWKRRSAILCQLKFKRDTDLDLLYACIEPAMDEAEFFLRKAIGWALREYAKTDADEVLRYVKVHRQRLSPLSKREALKALLRSGTLQRVP